MDIKNRSVVRFFVRPFPTLSSPPRVEPADGLAHSAVQHNFKVSDHFVRVFGHAVSDPPQYHCQHGRGDREVRDANLPSDAPAALPGSRGTDRTVTV